MITRMGYGQFHRCLRKEIAEGASKLGLHDTAKGCIYYFFNLSHYHHFIQVYGTYMKMVGFGWKLVV
jgi:hypothetical protein